METGSDPVREARRWRMMAFALFFLLVVGIGGAVYLGMVLSKRPSNDANSAAARPAVTPSTASAEVAEKTRLYTQGTEGQVETEEEKAGRIRDVIETALRNHESLKDTPTKVRVLQSEQGKSYVEVTYDVGEVSPGDREVLIGQFNTILNNSPFDRIMDNWTGIDEFAKYVRNYCWFLEYKPDGVNSVVATFCIRGEVSDYKVVVNAFYYNRYGERKDFKFLEARLPDYELRRVKDWEHARPMELVKLIHIDVGGPF